MLTPLPRPHVCAPGQQIAGAHSTSNQVGFGTLGNGVHIRGSGTSFAALRGQRPCFPAGGAQPTPGSNPTDPIRNTVEGWGRINLRNSIPGGVPTACLNENVPLPDNGQTYVFTGQVANGGEPLRVTLARNVFRPPQPAGTPVVIRMVATAPNGDGIPGNSEAANQHFALAIGHAVASTPTTPLLSVACFRWQRKWVATATVCLNAASRVL